MLFFAVIYVLNNLDNIAVFVIFIYSLCITLVKRRNGFCELVQIIVLIFCSISEGICLTFQLSVCVIYTCSLDFTISFFLNCISSEISKSFSYNLFFSSDVICLNRSQFSTFKFVFCGSKDTASDNPLILGNM